MKTGRLMDTGNPVIRQIRRVRIPTRLFVTFLGLSLVPVIVIGLFAYNRYTRSINTKLGESAEQAVRLLNKNLSTELGYATIYINTLSIADTVQDILEAEPTESSYPAQQTVRAIRRQIDSTPLQLSYMKNIRIVDRGGKVLYDLGYDEISPDIFQGLLEAADAASPGDCLTLINTYRGNDYLVVGRTLYRFSTTSKVGTILLYLDEKILGNNIYADIGFGEDSNILLMGRDGRVLSSKDRSLLGSSLDNDDNLYSRILAAEAEGRSALNTAIGGVDSLVIFDYNSAYGTYFIATIPQSYITGETREINKNLAIAAIVMALASFGMTFVIYLSIVQPIRHIVRCCNVIADEEVERQIGDDSPDEMGFLSRTIDHIIAELKNMALEWQHNQRRKRELELEMLQYQINPHFLFNTLNTLKWIAVINDVPALSDGMSSLSSLLQSTLVRKDELIPIRDELENLRHYFYIQRLRFADQFQVEYQLDESLLDSPIPRFILQPIAENSIIHGIGEQGRILSISVACLRNAQGDVELILSDDGPGFDVNAVKAHRKERFSGIGLTNVDERLRLYFGREHGLSIHSAVGAGTVCRIVIPSRWIGDRALEKEVDDHVPDSVGGR